MMTLWDFYGSDCPPCYKKIFGVAHGNTFTVAYNYPFRWPLRNRHGVEIAPARIVRDEWVGREFGRGESRGAYKHKKNWQEFAFGQKVACLFPWIKPKELN